MGTFCFRFVLVRVCVKWWTEAEQNKKMSTFFIFYIYILLLFFLGGMLFSVIRVWSLHFSTSV